MQLLDFEKPVADLEQKLDELRRYDAEDAEVDLTAQIAALERRVEQLKQQVYTGLTRWQRVQLARHPDRPYTLDYVQALTRGFVELHGDRLFGDDRAMIAGLGTFEGRRFGGRDQTVALIGHQKGRATNQRKYRNFGMPNPEGYRKALRVMKFAAKCGKPVVALLDTPGAFPGLEAEERGQAEAIARNFLEMTRLPVPSVFVIVGEGAAGGALGSGVGDRLLMLENAWYSVISPESCASILWRAWDYKEEAARALRLTAPDLIEQGIVDEIVPEPLGGAHRDPESTFDAVGHAIARTLGSLTAMTHDARFAARMAKFDSIGAFEEA